MCAMLAMIVPKELGNCTMACNLFLGILPRSVPLGSPPPRAHVPRRAFDKVAVACPSSCYPEVYRIGGDQVPCTGKAMEDLLLSTC
jgi:hypothetical protein